MFAWVNFFVSCCIFFIQIKKKLTRVWESSSFSSKSFYCTRRCDPEIESQGECPWKKVQRENLMKNDPDKSEFQVYSPPLPRHSEVLYCRKDSRWVIGYNHMQALGTPAELLFSIHFLIPLILSSSLVLSFVLRAFLFASFFIVRMKYWPSKTSRVSRCQKPATSPRKCASSKFGFLLVCLSDRTLGNCRSKKIFYTIRCKWSWQIQAIEVRYKIKRTKTSASEPVARARGWRPG